MFKFAAEGVDFQPEKWKGIDIEKIENEFVLTSAEYLLSLAQVKMKFKGMNIIVGVILFVHPFFFFF